MTKLDRLSSLLEGLAPKVELNDAPTGHALHILVDGNIQSLQFSPEKTMLLFCPSNFTLSCLQKQLNECAGKQWKRWMTFSISFKGPVAYLFEAECQKPFEIYLDKADRSLVQIVQLIVEEQSQARCGHPVLMSRAGDILFVGLLRHLVANPQRNAGLFFALSHPQIAKSVVAMHSDTAKEWSLELLAEEAGMSRTSFATHFKKIMHITPKKYLENLRLKNVYELIAAGHTLQQAAVKTGYSSASTLARALSRYRIAGASETVLQRS